MPLGVAATPTRDEGVSKLSGELRSTSEDISWEGGEEKRGGPGLDASQDDPTRRREAGGEVMSGSLFISCCGGERA